MEVDDAPPTTDDSVRSAARTDAPIPEPPFWGVREIEVDLDDVFPYLDRHVLFKLHWGGRGKKGEEWRRIVEGHDGEEGFAPRLERMWREQDYLHPRARLGYFPCAADGNELVVFDPEDRERELERLVFPRQPKHDRICLDRLLPAAGRSRSRRARRRRPPGRDRRPRGDRADQEARVRRRVRRAALRPRPGCPGGGGARRVAPLARCGAISGIEPDQGRRYSWGYPACPDQSEHEKVWRLLGLEEIGMTLSGGYAVEPEQSTVAIVAHHPQAVYFGMKSGFIPEGEGAGRADRGHRARRRAAARVGPARGQRRGRGGRRRRAPAGLGIQTTAARSPDAIRWTTCGSAKPFSSSSSSVVSNPRSASQPATRRCASALRRISPGLPAPAAGRPGSLPRP